MAFGDRYFGARLGEESRPWAFAFAAGAFALAAWSGIWWADADELASPGRTRAVYAAWLSASVGRASAGRVDSAR